MTHVMKLGLQAHSLNRKNNSLTSKGEFGL